MLKKTGIAKNVNSSVTTNALINLFVILFVPIKGLKVLT